MQAWSLDPPLAVPGGFASQQLRDRGAEDKHVEILFNLAYLLRRHNRNHRRTHFLQISRYTEPQRLIMSNQQNRGRLVARRNAYHKRRMLLLAQLERGSEKKREIPHRAYYPRR